MRASGAYPIGRRLRVSQGDNEWREIVGVAGNVKHAGLDEQPRAGVYESYLQHPYFNAFSLVVRTTADEPTAVIPAVRTVVRRLDRDLPLARVRTLEALVDGLPAARNSRPRSSGSSARRPCCWLQLASTA